jgi:hypothetical protein
MSKKARDIVNIDWSWDGDENQYRSDAAIKLACLLEIARALIRISVDLRSLGEDGLHDLIREGLEAVRRKKRRPRRRKKK